MLWVSKLLLIASERLGMVSVTFPMIFGGPF
jgi:hypothetical protein